MIYISVVSHGHYDIIKKLAVLAELALENDINVCIKDNLNEEVLKSYCKKNNIKYIPSKYPKGFGENNNCVFNHLKEKISDDDYFVIYNPDLSLSASQLREAIKTMNSESASLGTVNLYKDNNYTIPDNSVRCFPGLIDFISSYAFKKNTSIVDKSTIDTLKYVDWAAGSLLIFKSKLYKNLKGFNLVYFMYCEDIDICWRARKIYNEKVLYMPHIIGIHHAQHNNRKLFSRHFIWHLKSTIVYLSYRYGLRSRIKTNLI